jgi:hypothetical protein
MRCTLGKTQPGNPHLCVQPIGMDVQHAIRPVRYLCRVACMPDTRLDQYHAACGQQLTAVSMLKQGLALVHDAQRILGMHVQAVAMWRLLAHAQLCPRQGG